MNTWSASQAILISGALLFVCSSAYALDCPAAPEQVRKDWETEVTAAVGKIGPVKGGELQTRTRMATVDLLGKLPESGKIYLEQMMFAAYCSALRDDGKTPEAEKAQLLRTYNEEVRKTLSVQLPKKNSGTKPSSEVARIKLTQMSLAYTPHTFVQSARNGDVTAVRLFMAAGMDVNVTDDEGLTALMAAAGKGHSTIVESLMKAGAEINKSKDDMTALAFAAAIGDIKIVRLLLSKAADTRAINDACWQAAYRRQREILRILMDHRADVNVCGALRAVIEGGGPNEPSDAELDATVRFLLDLGANVNGKSNQGETPLVAAASKGYEAVVRTLLERGADVNVVCDCDGYYDIRHWTALQIAVKKRHTAVVEVLLAQAADPNHKNSEGSTALHMVKDVRAAQALLVKGADVTARDKQGKTALMMPHTAVIAQVLLDGGAGVNAIDKNGWTALMYAAYVGEEDRVRTLLERGADVDAKNAKGETALIIAASRANHGVVLALLERSARINEKDVRGRTALTVAQELLDGPDKTKTIRLLHEAETK
jgi:ankyrin repeat protein